MTRSQYTFGVAWTTVFVLLLIVAPLSWGRPRRRQTDTRHTVDLHGFGDEEHVGVGINDAWSGDGGFGEIEYDGFGDGMGEAFGMPGVDGEAMFIDVGDGFGQDDGWNHPGNFGVGGGWDEQFSDMFYHADSFMASKNFAIQKPVL